MALCTGQKLGVRRPVGFILMSPLEGVGTGAVTDRGQQDVLLKWKLFFPPPPVVPEPDGNAVSWLEK